MYVSPTAVTARRPAVAGGADADGRGSGGAFQMCSCGITAVSGCCAGYMYTCGQPLMLELL